MMTYPLHYIHCFILSTSVTLHKLLSDASIRSAILISGPRLHYRNCFQINFQVDYIITTLHNMGSNEFRNDFEMHGKVFRKQWQLDDRIPLWPFVIS